MMGVYHWLVNRQKKALKSWRKSILEGEQLGARLALSRTYFEVGRRLGESGSNHDRLNGIANREYIEKARALFVEMDLQLDLDELRQVENTKADEHSAS